MNNFQKIQIQLAARAKDPKSIKLRNKGKQHFLKSFKNVRMLEPAECPEISALAWSYALKENVPIPDIYFASGPRKLRATGGTVTVYADFNVPAIQVNAEFIQSTSFDEKAGILGHEIGHIAFRLKDSTKYAILGIAAKIARLAGWIYCSMAIINSFGQAPGLGKKIGIFAGMFIATGIVKNALVSFRISAKSEEYADRCAARLGGASGLKSFLSSDRTKAVAEEDASHYKGIFSILPRLFYGSRFDIWENAGFAPKNAFEKTLGKALHAIFYNTPSVSERLRLLDKYEAELGKGKTA